MTDATDLLAPSTGMGAVTLRAADLDRMIEYYRDGLPPGTPTRSPEVPITW